MHHHSVVVRFPGLTLPKENEVFEQQISRYMVVTVDSVKPSDGGFIGLKLGEFRRVKGNHGEGTPNHSLKVVSFNPVRISGKSVVSEVKSIFILGHIVKVSGNKREEDVGLKNG